jgi:peptide-methionine (S)-S-oxide reductase
MSCHPASHARFFGVVVGCAIAAAVACGPARAAVPFPDPAVDDPLASVSGQSAAVVAGGCFWGIEAVFEHLKGVTDAVSGYSGGPAASAKYEMVGTGRTGHAESVKVTYDPSRISYGQLLKVFFAVAHNPTELNRQGPDTGPQYRSAVFYASSRQQEIAQRYISQLGEARAFSRPIVTEVVPLQAFYPAEPYHQDYAFHHPDAPYIVINDRPKVYALKREYPALYVEPR